LWITPEIRKQIIFEKEYGRDYGFSSDDYFLQHQAHVSSRERLFQTCDMLILPKPVPQDLEQMREHTIIWGWLHCVQQNNITQAAIERKLTLIAWEAMHQWSSSGEKLMHIFYKNNEIAGYSAVLHALQLLGIDGHYGPSRRVIIMGYGSVSRGAIYALQGRGFNNIHVYTRRLVHLVADQNPDVYYHHLHIDQNGKAWAVYNDRTTRPFIEELAQADIICNGILQDTDHPIMFVDDYTINNLKPRSIIIDISCDKGMGFSFARPTTFNDPILTLHRDIYYYSVDHTPTYLWNAASREISKALIPYLPILAAGPHAWEKDETVRRAIEIHNGIIRNPKILSFQKRQPEYPYPCNE